VDCVEEDDGAWVGQRVDADGESWDGVGWRIRSRILGNARRWRHEVYSRISGILWLQYFLDAKKNSSG